LKTFVKLFLILKSAQNLAKILYFTFISLVSGLECLILIKRKPCCNGKNVALLPKE